MFEVFLLLSSFLFLNRKFIGKWGFFYKWSLFFSLYNLGIFRFFIKQLKYLFIVFTKGITTMALFFLLYFFIHRYNKFFLSLLHRFSLYKIFIWNKKVKKTCFRLVKCIYFLLYICSIFNFVKVMFFFIFL